MSKAHLSFCATDGIKKGSTPGDVFELMLQEVQGITPSAAAGIRTEYESFQILMDAYERAERRGGRERAEMLLQDCQVSYMAAGSADKSDQEPAQWSSQRQKAQQGAHPISAEL